MNHHVTTVGGKKSLGSQNLSMNSSSNMIIIDFILGACYVPACSKCFMRIVSFNSHINPGDGYYFILYLLHEETALARITSPRLPRSHSRLTPFLYSSTIYWEPSMCSGSGDVAVKETKSPSIGAYILEPLVSMEEHRPWRQRTWVLG